MESYLLPKIQRLTMQLNNVVTQFSRDIPQDTGKRLKKRKNMHICDYSDKADRAAPL